MLPCSYEVLAVTSSRKQSPRVISFNSAIFVYRLGYLVFPPLPGIFGLICCFLPWMPCLSYPSRHYRNLWRVSNETRCIHTWWNCDDLNSIYRKLRIHFWTSYSKHVNCRFQNNSCTLVGAKKHALANRSSINHFVRKWVCNCK